MSELAYGSLCTGYDGLGRALSLAGASLRHVFHAEVEAPVAHVLKLTHPDVPNVGDIKVAPWHLAPHVDVLSSGDPCQSISIAGRQAGRDDPRFLWPWVREAYREVAPGAIFFENVANIVSHDGGRTLAERFEHLRGDGYAVRWTVLGACAVGAPHHRHRWYAVAGYVGPGAPEVVRVGGDKAICGAPRSGGRFLLPSPMARDGSTRGEGLPECWANRLGTRPDRATKGIPLGAVVNLLPTPRTSDVFGAGLHGDGGPDLRTVISLLPTPRATDIGTEGRRSSDGWRPQLGQAVHALLPTPRASDGPNGGPNQRNGRGEYDALPEAWGKYAEAVALWEQITGVPAPDPTEAAPKGGRRLSPALPEWMMGLAPGTLTNHMGRVDALRAAGNGVVPQAAAAAWRMLTAPLAG